MKKSIVTTLVLVAALLGCGTDPEVKNVFLEKVPTVNDQIHRPGTFIAMSGLPENFEMMLQIYTKNNRQMVAQVSISDGQTVFIPLEPGEYYPTGQSNNGEYECYTFEWNYVVVGTGEPESTTIEVYCQKLYPGTGANLTFQVVDVANVFVKSGDYIPYGYSPRATNTTMMDVVFSHDITQSVYLNEIHFAYSEFGQTTSQFSIHECNFVVNGVIHAGTTIGLTSLFPTTYEIENVMRIDVGSLELLPGVETKVRIQCNTEMQSSGYILPKLKMFYGWYSKISYQYLQSQLPVFGEYVFFE